MTREPIGLCCRASETERTVETLTKQLSQLYSECCKPGLPHGLPCELIMNGPATLTAWANPQRPSMASLTLSNFWPFTVP
jgi:hypothetical protein